MGLCIRLLLLVLFTIVAATCSQEDPPEANPLKVNDWTTGNPADAGFDEVALEKISAEIEEGAFPNTHALLIEHDGQLVYERYFSGTDDRWGEPLGHRDFNSESLHDLRSISKSVTATLLGIALKGDFQQAVERPVLEYLPRLSREGEQGSITLHQVLTMTAGLEWNEMDVSYTEETNDEIRLYSVEDPAKSVLTRPIEFTPGSTWYYSGGLSQVVASIVTELTGQTIQEYAREKLFGPLGIEEFEWLGPGTWIDNNPSAMSGLRLKARDLAKIGSVYLHGGQWKGQQIVPSDWVRLSSMRHVQEIGDWSMDGVWGYGYQWWVGDLPDGPRVVAGFGNGNQRLFIIPEEELVITIFAGEYNRSEHHSERILERVLKAR
ncbi:MAG: serine hydrolase [Acidobacteriota bacterium]|nr:MAG: serine hydrolase [Acidobacteriota bacterium]